jgi:hypothetical protein
MIIFIASSASPKNYIIIILKRRQFVCFSNKADSVKRVSALMFAKYMPSLRYRNYKSAMRKEGSKVLFQGVQIEELYIPVKIKICKSLSLWTRNFHKII